MNIYVAVYSHRHGTDVRAFVNEADAWQWRDDIASEWWDQEICVSEDEPKPDTDIGEVYFERMADSEYFSVEGVPLEGYAIAKEGV